MDAADAMREAWRANQRINDYLLDHISDEGMQCTLSKRGGRNVSRQFAHLHNVRIMQLDVRARDLAKGLHKFATKDEPDRETLKRHMAESAARIETFLADCLAGKPKRRGFKRGPWAAFAYFVAHDSHHRGNILLTLKQCGHNVEQPVRYAIWDWDRV